MSSTPPPRPLDPVLAAIFEQVYRTELVYVPDCWKLCGDAHCCSFSRYKKRFRMMAREPFQELPLLPGEFQFLVSKGWHAQFQDFEHKVIEFPLDGYTIRAESVVSRRPGCACDHATRPTICRLYPLLPVFDVDGALLGVEPLGIYEELERIAGLPRACRIDELPFAQVTPFLALNAAIGGSALLRFHLEAYRLTKAHVAGRLAERFQPGKDIFTTLETAFLLGKLTDGETLRGTLQALLDTYDRKMGGTAWRDLA